LTAELPFFFFSLVVGFFKDFKRKRSSKRKKKKSGAIYIYIGSVRASSPLFFLFLRRKL